MTAPSKPETRRTYDLNSVPAASPIGRDEYRAAARTLASVANGLNAKGDLAEILDMIGYVHDRSS